MTQPIARANETALRALIAESSAAGGGVYLGSSCGRFHWAGRESAVLVLGPPRSGKTSSLVIPTVLTSEGAVISTSTKPDVMAATALSRQKIGKCLLYDPTGSVRPPPGVQIVRWSPVQSCGRWDDALAMADSIVATATSFSRLSDANESHWTAQARVLIAPLLHAAALDGRSMVDVMKWISQHQCGEAFRILDQPGVGVGSQLAAHALQSIAETEQREQSSIWSTASTALAGYRGEAALASTVGADFDPAAFCEEPSTLYICAPGRLQATSAPLIVGLLSDIRDAAYRRADHWQEQGKGQWQGGFVEPTPSRETPNVATKGGHPVIFALDEVANIAPIPYLPRLASEGAGQGLITMACFQDLSQARARWGAEAKGFASLFAVKVVLPGIGDVETLRAISTLVGEHEVVSRSVTTGTTSRRFGIEIGLRILGSRPALAGREPTVTWSTKKEPRLAPDVISRGFEGSALVLDRRNQARRIDLTPAHGAWPFSEMCHQTHERTVSGSQRTELCVPIPDPLSQSAPTRTPTKSDWRPPTGRDAVGER